MAEIFENQTGERARLGGEPTGADLDLDLDLNPDLERGANAKLPAAIAHPHSGLTGEGELGAPDGERDQIPSPALAGPFAAALVAQALSAPRLASMEEFDADIAIRVARLETRTG